MGIQRGGCRLRLTCWTQDRKTLQAGTDVPRDSAPFHHVERPLWKSRNSDI